ncbi:hypothetical protein LTR84_009300 [Exophiala bonariae]|uniref:Uncharacterized protein n=1 Tax=Exophiala bonariae TaxID=1690606 RepID=A0AAV9MUW4_9EURO|nr:hypothetical protein LTR84_009300 [Exophiala bonariae]
MSSQIADIAATTMKTVSASPSHTRLLGYPLLETDEVTASPRDVVLEGAAGLYVAVTELPPTEVEVILAVVLAPVVEIPSKPRQVRYE